jgi:phage gpG-like protein
MAKKINFKAIKRKVKQVKATTPKLIGGIAVEHFKRSFRDGGFTDDRLSPWKPRKRGNKADKATGRRRAILVDSGDLRRSIRTRAFSFTRIIVGSYGTAYAGRHNRGLDRMPKRQFIGSSHKMNLKIRLLIRKRFKQAIAKQ